MNITYGLDRIRNLTPFPISPRIVKGCRERKTSHVEVFCDDEFESSKVSRRDNVKEIKQDTAYVMLYMMLIGWQEE